MERKNYKDCMKERVLNETHYHIFDNEFNFNKMLKGFLIAFVMFIFCLTMINLIQHNFMLNEDVYIKCTDSCTNWKTDLNSISVSIKEGEGEIVFDRTECINSCNDLYITLENKQR